MLLSLSASDLLLQVVSSSRCFRVVLTFTHFFLHERLFRASLCHMRCVPAPLFSTCVVPLLLPSHRFFRVKFGTEFIGDCSRSFCAAGLRSHDAYGSSSLWVGRSHLYSILCAFQCPRQFPSVPRKGFCLFRTFPRTVSGRKRISLHVCCLPLSLCQRILGSWTHLCPFLFLSLFWTRNGGPRGHVRDTAVGRNSRKIHYHDD